MPFNYQQCYRSGNDFMSLVNGGVVRKAVGELQGAEARLHGIRRGDIRRNIGRHLHLRRGLCVSGGGASSRNDHCGDNEL